MTTLYAVYNPEPMPELECPLAILQHRLNEGTLDEKLPIFDDEDDAVEEMEKYHENGDDHIDVAEIEVTDWNYGNDS